MQHIRDATYQTTTMAATASSTMQDETRQKLENGILRRKASLTAAEEYFLHALLIDDDIQEYDTQQPQKDTAFNIASAATLNRPVEADSQPHAARSGKAGGHLQAHEERLKRATAVLDDDTLFSIPPNLTAESEHGNKESLWSSGVTTTVVPQRPRRPSTLGLWQAHKDGVAPKVLVAKGSLTLPAPPAPTAVQRSWSTGAGTVQQQQQQPSSSSPPSSAPPTKVINKRLDEIQATDLSNSVAVNDDSGVEAFFDSSGNDDLSDVEVRHNHKDDGSDDSSWDENDHTDHYDTWEVLKDEYAEDFGFNYSTRGLSPPKVLEEGVRDLNTFQILGTSVDDKSAQPHVMSPPLMDAIMAHLPVNLVGENYWLKFSLIRDGASLQTLRRYVRASQYTVLAIETPRGEVFGSFTCSPWRTNPSFFGSGGSAFVWKMRSSRRTPCSSLFDQAQLEAQVDVYHVQDPSRLVQVCRLDRLAVGGDDDRPRNELDDIDEILKNNGFAIALEDDLLRGTTSPSETFHNPSLCGECGDATEIFDVAGLEVWSFTPCMDIKSAERLEMTKFFIEESQRTLSDRSMGSNQNGSSSNSTGFSSRDLDARKFYERVGYDSESQERRDLWQHRNITDNVGAGGGRAFGASPRFS